MPSTLIHVYDTLSTAENARRQLLESGIPFSHVRLASQDDEAGPVQGNFVSGNDESANEKFLRHFGSVIGGETDIYERDYQDAIQRGTILLTVRPDDDEESRLASGIMQRCGGMDFNAWSAGRRS